MFRSVFLFLLRCGKRGTGGTGWYFHILPSSSANSLPPETNSAAGNALMMPQVRGMSTRWSESCTSYHIVPSWKLTVRTWKDAGTQKESIPTTANSLLVSGGAADEDIWKLLLGYLYRFIGWIHPHTLVPNGWIIYWHPGWGVDPTQWVWCVRSFWAYFCCTKRLPDFGMRVWLLGGQIRELQEEMTWWSCSVLAGCFVDRWNHHRPRFAFFAMVKIALKTRERFPADPHPFRRWPNKRNGRDGAVDPWILWIIFGWESCHFRWRFRQPVSLSPHTESTARPEVGDLEQTSDSEWLLWALFQGNRQFENIAFIIFLRFA